MEQCKNLRSVKELDEYIKVKEIKTESGRLDLSEVKRPRIKESKKVTKD